MVKSKVFIYKKHFEGLPKESDFEIADENLPPIKNGEFLAEAVYLSVDPYMRNRALSRTLGEPFLGSQVAKVIDSKNPKYPVGTYVVGQFGWRTHTISDGSPGDFDFIPWKIPDFEGLPLSYSLGILGMPGNTAYFGFLEICQPKSGETVVVTGAAGAVGSIVGQLAKIKGCTVIGIAGSDDKGKWLIDELNFDHFINYKDENFASKLAEVAPKGIDCFFDNVGGEITSIILSQMNLFGRVSICGAISGYNNKHADKVSPVTPLVLGHQLKMEGFIVNRWLSRWNEGILENKKWIKQGKLKYRETITEGFENMVEAFINMLKGGNFGKAVVKV